MFSLTLSRFSISLNMRFKSAVSVQISFRDRTWPIKVIIAITAKCYSSKASLSSLVISLNSSSLLYISISIRILMLMNHKVPIRRYLGTLRCHNNKMAVQFSKVSNNKKMISIFIKTRAVIRIV